MHVSGISMISRQIRGGDVVRTSETEFFDFDQQGLQVVQQVPFQVLPGDEFQVQCTYSNPSREREFGISSQEGKFDCIIVQRCTLLSNAIVC